MKYYYIMERYTGLCDGVYPEYSADMMLKGAKELYPNGDFCLIEYTIDFPDEKLFTGMNDEVFTAKIEDARAELEDVNDIEKASLDGFTSFGKDEFGINNV